MKPFDDRSMNNLIQKRLPPYRPVPGVSPQRLGDVQSSIAPRYRKAPLLEKQQNEAPRPAPILKIKPSKLPHSLSLHHSKSCDLSVQGTSALLSVRKAHK